jgi:hypothetical protein
MNSWRTARGEIRTLSIRSARFRRMPAHRPAKSKKPKIPPATIQQIRLDGRFLTEISC